MAQEKPDEAGELFKNDRFTKQVLGNLDVSSLAVTFYRDGILAANGGRGVCRASWEGFYYQRN